MNFFNVGNTMHHSRMVQICGPPSSLFPEASLSRCQSEPYVPTGHEWCFVIMVRCSGGIANAHLVTRFLCMMNHGHSRVQVFKERNP